MIVLGNKYHLANIMQTNTNLFKRSSYKSTLVKKKGRLKTNIEKKRLLPPSFNDIDFLQI